MRRWLHQSRRLCWLLAAILLVPPTLYPCCCTAAAGLTTDQPDVPSALAEPTAGLSPCCQQRLAEQTRLLAEQRSFSEQQAPADSDSDHNPAKCGCQAKVLPALRQGLIWRAPVSDGILLGLWPLVRIDVSVELPSPHAPQWEPDGARSVSVPELSQLCRWVI